MKLVTTCDSSMRPGPACVISIPPPSAPTSKIAALLKICADDLTPAGARDATILALLCGAGLRWAEADSLDLANYDPESGALMVFSGKGDKDRMIYAPVGTRSALRDWIIARGAAPGPLFYEWSRVATQYIVA